MIELRVITPGKYWTVYKGGKYIGAIAFHEFGDGPPDVYTAVKDGDFLGNFPGLDKAKAQFEDAK